MEGRFRTVFYDRVLLMIPPRVERHPSWRKRSQSPPILPSALKQALSHQSPPSTFYYPMLLAPRYLSQSIVPMTFFVVVENEARARAGVMMHEGPQTH